ncbi:MAG: TrmH family RNA methyltransferase, partial [Acidimicrobiia bacterium]
VEGANVVATALDAGADFEAVYLAPAAEAACGALVASLLDAGVPTHPLAPGVMERIAGTVTPQPVLAVARRTARHDPAELRGADLVVVGVDVRDPGNAGTLIRSAEAAGAGGVIFCRGSVDVTNPKTVRASAGALFCVPVLEGGHPEEVLAVLGDLGLRRIGAAPRGGGAPARTDLVAPVALVLGNEAWGLPSAVQAALDETVTIPMPGRAESINLAMAASVLLYETRRQRSAGGAGS